VRVIPDPEVIADEEAAKASELLEQFSA